MKTLRWDSKNGGRDRTKTVHESQVDVMLSNGWIMCDGDGDRGPVEKSDPYIDTTIYGVVLPVVPGVVPSREENPLSRLEKSVNSYLDPAKKRRGRPSKFGR